MIAILTKVVGVTFSNEEYNVNRQDIIKQLSGKEKVSLRREPKNRFDTNAVAVYVDFNNKKYKIGYLKAELAGIVAEMWKEYRFISSISEIRMGDEEKNISWGISLEIKKARLRKYE